MLPDVSELFKVRNRILGVLLQEARQSAGREVQECADLLEVSVDEYRAFESGWQSPTLPQLEVLSYYFQVPIGHFWGTETLSAKRSAEDIKERVPELLMLRKRIIGMKLRKLREDAGMTVAQVAERSEVDAGRIEQAEQGKSALPVSELETVVRAAQSRIDDLVDGHGMIGNWLQSQEQFEEFLRLSPDLRDFVLKPINQSYLDLAVRLSKMKVDELRSIAESILEITY